MDFKILTISLLSTKYIHYFLTIMSYQRLSIWKDWPHLSPWICHTIVSRKYVTSTISTTYILLISQVIESHRYLLRKWQDLRVWVILSWQRIDWVLFKVLLGLPPWQTVLLFLISVGIRLLNTILWSTVNYWRSWRFLSWHSTKLPSARVLPLTERKLSQLSNLSPSWMIDL